MNRIAAVTVIRGQGECQAYINGVASAEIRRQQDRMRAETERARTVEASRDRLLTCRLTEIAEKLDARPGLLHRLHQRAVDAWALLWGTFICWSEALGLIEEVDDDETL